MPLVSDQNSQENLTPRQPRGLAVLACLLLIAAVVAVLVWSPNFQWPLDGNTLAGGDLLQEWVGGYIVRTGQADRLYDLQYAKRLEHEPELVGFSWDESRYLPMVYPPFYYQAVSPLAGVPYRMAIWLWAGLMTACLVASVVLVLGLRHRHRAKCETAADTAAIAVDVNNAETESTQVNAWCWVLVPAIVCYVPLIESLTSGQKSTLCLLLLTGTYALLKSGRELSAGMLFGLMAFKPQLALVLGLALLFKRRVRFVLGATITLTLLLGASLAVSPTACLDYVKFATGTADYVQTGGYALEKSHCLYGFFSLLLGAGSHLARITTLVSTLGIVYLLVRMLSGEWNPTSRRFDAQFGGLVAATILLSPHLFTYDLTVLLLLMLIEWRHSAGTCFTEATCRVAGSSSGSVDDRANPGGFQVTTSQTLLALFLLPSISTMMAASVGLQITVPLLVWLVYCQSKAARQSSTFPQSSLAAGQTQGPRTHVYPAS